MTTATVLATALGSALAAACSSVLQHRSARSTPPQAAAGIRLLAYLLTRPLWLAGFLSAAVGLVLHAVALAGGRLALVQPLLVSGLVFALPVSLLLDRRRPQLPECLWAVVLVGGLAAFLLAAHPHAGVAPAPDGTLLSAVGGCLGVLAALVMAARTNARASSLLLGAGGGIAFGIASALVKQCTALGAAGLPDLLSNWVPYGTVAIGVVAVSLSQFAYRAGPLALSLPAMTISDPASSVAVGALAFHERLAGDPLAVAVQAAAVLSMTVGAWRIARQSSDAGPRATESPAERGTRHASREHEPP